MNVGRDLSTLNEFSRFTSVTRTVYDWTFVIKLRSGGSKNRAVPWRGVACYAPLVNENIYLGVCVCERG